MKQNEKKIKYEESILAFIDILGFKQMIVDSEKDTSKIILINPHCSRLPHG